MVGRGERNITVHTGFIRTLSPPLFALISNGTMKESIERTAFLEDVEEDTFVGFCEFAYRKTYTTPDRTSDADECPRRSDGISPESPQGDTQTNQERSPENTPLPEPGLAPVQGWDFPPEPEPLAYNEPISDWEPSLPPGRVLMDSSGTYMTKLAWINFKKKTAFGIPAPREVHIQYPYDGLWEQFTHLQFDGNEASFSPNPDLVFHGKLYVFADRYLVTSLRTQCLKSLHRDLCGFNLSSQSLSHVLDLLEYAYMASGRDSPDGGYSLRELIVHYTACKAPTLAQIPRFQGILDRYSEMGSDLVMKLVN